MLKSFKNIFLILIFLFLTYLAYLVKSSSKLDGFASDEESELLEQDINSTSLNEDKSQLELKGFERHEVEKGKKLWSIKAKNAKVYKDQNITHVDEVEVEVARKNKDSSVFIESKRARLSIVKDQMEKADLEGMVLIRVDDTLSLEAEFATYDAIKRNINVPGKVKIFGTGYILEGEGFDMNVDKEGFVLRKSVQTKFTKGAKVPSPLGDKANKK